MKPIHLLVKCSEAVTMQPTLNRLLLVVSFAQLQRRLWSEHKKYVERDPALSCRFQLVKVDEPSIEESIVILMRGLKPLYEKAHGVYITGEALETVTNYLRVIAVKKLPDKAIDILDTACARVSTAKDTPPKRLSYLDNKIP